MDTLAGVPAGGSGRPRRRALAALCATAIAPTVGAALAAYAGGYPTLFLILAATGAASGVLALASGAAPQPAAARLPPVRASPAD